jgi:hypothetical protein
MAVRARVFSRLSSVPHRCGEVLRRAVRLDFEFWADVDSTDTRETYKSGSNEAQRRRGREAAAVTTTTRFWQPPPDATEDA